MGWLVVPAEVNAPIESEQLPEPSTLEGSAPIFFELLKDVKNIFIFYLMTLLGNVRNYRIIP